MRLIYRFIAFLLTVLTLNFQSFPAFANLLEISDDISSKTCKEKNIIMHANNILPLTFVDDFNANKSEEGMVVRFRLDNRFTDADGDVLPANTMFYGNIDSLTKSKFGFRKASAKISINKMILPDGRVYYINAKPTEDTLTSSAAANIAKGVATSAAAAGVGMVGAIVIAIECLSVGGIILAPYTGAAVGIALGATSKGVNFKVPAGTKINIIFKQPVDAFDE